MSKEIKILFLTNGEPAVMPSGDFKKLPPMLKAAMIQDAIIALAQLRKEAVSEGLPPAAPKPTRDWDALSRELQNLGADEDQVESLSNEVAKMAKEGKGLSEVETWAAQQYAFGMTPEALKLVRAVHSWNSKHAE